MKNFEDKKGDTWALEITFGQIKKVKKELDVNLGLLLNDGCQLLNDILGDPLQFIPVLYVLLEEQITERRLTSSQFAERIFGDAYEQAQNAFIEAYTDFCPSRQKEMVLTLLAKSREAQNTLLDKLKNLDMTSSESVMNMQESVEYTQKTFPFAS